MPPPLPLARGVPQRAPAHCPLPAAGGTIAPAERPLRGRREAGREGRGKAAAAESDYGTPGSLLLRLVCCSGGGCDPRRPRLAAPPPGRPHRSLHSAAAARGALLLLCPPPARLGPARPGLLLLFPRPRAAAAASPTHKAALRTAAHSSALTHRLTITLSSAPRRRRQGRPGAALSPPPGRSTQGDPPASAGPPEAAPAGKSRRKSRAWVRQAERERAVGWLGELWLRPHPARLV